MSGEEKRKRIKAATKRLTVRNAVEVVGEGSVRSIEDACGSVDQEISSNGVHAGTVPETGEAEEGITRAVNVNIGDEDNVCDRTILDASLGNGVTDGDRQNCIVDDSMLQDVCGAQQSDSATPVLEINGRAQVRENSEGVHGSKYR